MIVLLQHIAGVIVVGVILMLLAIAEEISVTRQKRQEKEQPFVRLPKGWK